MNHVRITEYCDVFFKDRDMTLLELKLIDMEKNIFAKQKPENPSGEKIIKIFELKKNKTKIADIKMIYTTYNFDKNIQTTTRSGLMIALIAFFLLAVLIIFLTKMISTPLKKIIESIHMIDLGKWDWKLKIDTHDEFKDIETHFNSMTKNILSKNEQLNQIQKMETVGTLAGGLAHDFNNVLGGITGTLSILKFKMNQKSKTISEDDLVKYVNTIEQSANRAADMVQQLLTLSRKNSVELNPVDLNVAVKHVMKICSNSFDKSVELDPHYSEKPAVVNADPTQIEQVILNLCVNGLHAMTVMKKEKEHWGGKLKVKLETVYADKLFLRLHPEAELTSYWVISVNDSGTGIPPDTLTKIFDPFFTTKDKGKGTGLGLSMVFNIVKQHNGFLDAYSEPGKGSLFKIYLPAIEEEVIENRQTEILNDIPKGEGLILVVDDEKIMREMAKEILEECGYNLIFAEDGENAVQLYKQRCKEIDLVVLDMVMPKMTGIEAYFEMKKINENVKVIIASGFKHDDRVEHLLKNGVKSFVQKPYTIDTLSKKVYYAIK